MMVPDYRTEIDAWAATQEGVSVRYLPNPFGIGGKIVVFPTTLPIAMIARGDQLLATVTLLAARRKVLRYYVAPFKAVNPSISPHYEHLAEAMEFVQQIEQYAPEPDRPSTLLANPDPDTEAMLRRQMVSGYEIAAMSREVMDYSIQQKRRRR